MAQWMARSQGWLRKRLQLAVVPTEGQSLALPQWQDTTLEEIVELINDKTESNRVLIEQVNALKAEIQQLKYSRPATGGFVDYPVEGRRRFGEETGERRQPIGTKPRGFVPSVPITPVPGVMVTVNAPDASNGEIAENIRRAISAISRPEFTGEIPVSRDRAECITRLDSSTFNRDS